MEEDLDKPKKALKVLSADRKDRKGVVSTNDFEDFLSKCCSGIKTMSITSHKDDSRDVGQEVLGLFQQLRNSKNKMQQNKKIKKEHKHRIQVTSFVVVSSESSDEDPDFHMGNNSPLPQRQQIPVTPVPIQQIQATSTSSCSLTPLQQIPATPMQQMPATLMQQMSATPVQGYVSQPETQVLVHAGTPSVRMNLPNRLCGVCVERECDAFFFPCGHTACLVCALQIESMGQRCPNCRAQIDSIKSMFYN